MSDGSIRSIGATLDWELSGPLPFPVLEGTAKTSSYRSVASPPKSSCEEKKAKNHI